SVGWFAPRSFGPEPKRRRSPPGGGSGAQSRPPANARSRRHIHDGRRGRCRLSRCVNFFLFPPPCPFFCSMIVTGVFSPFKVVSKVGAGCSQEKRRRGKGSAA